MVKRPVFRELVEGSVVPSPISVQPGELAPVFTDYIPADGRLLPPNREPEEAQKPVKALPNRDYVSVEETAELEARFRQRIEDEARRIWKESKGERDKFELAQVLVEKASKADKDKPSAELARAIRIVEQGVPMTKERAVEEAKRLVEAKSRLEFGQYWID